MPKREDLKRILIIGAGPIIIGQACEFDYSGSQACKALKEEGYEVVLVNSNPATIMTDPELADRTYIEPLNVLALEKIIDKERPDAILPTMGGQTGLNLSVELAKKGILEKYNVEMLGANLETIEKAESRELFKEAMQKIGVDLPTSFNIHSLDEAKKAVKELGYPLIIRASFTLGGSGGSVAFDEEEMIELVTRGLDESPVKEVLMEESILGWKEYELEVMRDKKDNVVIVCSIENFDPMGVHTGDSITVAPAQTLSDYEYQKLRDMSLDIIREIGVETGGSNIQFSINPDNGRIVVIEMNPRVSRSSALASKATGFAIAKIAAKLAVGYSLDEITNDITGETPASFEPALDYCVVKYPRWTFEKFPQAKPVLGVQMKSVGEAMSIGRTFKESFNKALRSLEIGVFGFESKGKTFSKEELIEKIRVPNPKRVFYLKEAFDRAFTVEELYDISKIDRWFLHQLEEIVVFEKSIAGKSLQDLSEATILKAKQMGFSDQVIARLIGSDEMSVRKKRLSFNIESTYKLVDTCAAEFESQTPYFYSTYEEEDEARVSDRDKVMILGGGPNRIGQGIEFDYMCVHASGALKEMGYESIMVNSNPETVSTDYDTSDKLYFEPLTLEDVLNIYEKEKPLGVIVQLGGQTPLNLTKKLEDAGVNILGTSPEAIDRAEDRKLFKELLQKLNLLQPENDTATSKEQAFEIARRIGYPVVVRPSYVLGGRSMEIVFSDEDLDYYMQKAITASPEKPILIDRFLEDAIEVDVDCVSDGEESVIAGIMQHTEEAGVHSGDSSCFLPYLNLSGKIYGQIRKATFAIAKELNIIGLMNIQYAVKDDELYLLEVNPRGSRTTPFVSKATGVPWVKVATALMMGKKLKDLDVKEVIPEYYSVKEVVFPFNKFPEVDTVLGPEMKSTGEVMGIDTDQGMAFAKAQAAAGSPLPESGTVLVTVNDRTKAKILEAVSDLYKMGFLILATEGTYKFLKDNNIPSAKVRKAHEGKPNLISLIQEHKVNLIFNTPLGKESRIDDKTIRQNAVRYQVPIITTPAGIKATVAGIKAMRKNEISVCALQDWYDVESTKLKL